MTEYTKEKECMVITNWILLHGMHNDDVLESFRISSIQLEDFRLNPDKAVESY